MAKRHGKKMLKPGLSHAEGREPTPASQGPSANVSEFSLSMSCGLDLLTAIAMLSVN